MAGRERLSVNLGALPLPGETSLPLSDSATESCAWWEQPAGRESSWALIREWPRPPIRASLGI